MGRWTAMAPGALGLLLAACHAQQPAPEDVTRSTGARQTGASEAAAPAPPTPPAPPAPIAGSSITAKTTPLDFAYRWPALPGDVPGLRAWLAKDAATARSRAEADAREDEAATKSSGFPFHRHSAEKSWSIAGDTVTLLSLSAKFSDYTGGAHGNTGFQPLLWNRATDSSVAFAALLADRKAGLAAIAEPFCPALNIERAKRRGVPVAAGSTDEFDRCPDLAQETIVPAAAAKDGAFTRLKLLLGPYDAGPYAEGSYEIEVPVTPAFVAALKPAWRASFSPA